MKEWTDIHVFSHPWKRMVQAAYRKYPNPYSAHIHSLDTLERTVSGRKLYSHRIFSTLWNIPAIVLKIVGTNDLMQIREQSVCDLNSETLTIYARNVSLAHLFTVDEKLEYTVCKDDPSKTILKQSACMDVHGIPLLGNLLEHLFMRNYETTISNGRLGVHFVAEQLMKEESTINETTAKHQDNKQ